MLQNAGCFALVLEKIPAGLAAEVSASLSIPTIGIGAGPDCDGQVLVTHDALGLTSEFNPRFVRHYANLAEIMTTAVENYVSDVRQHRFPDASESY
jgi:3-methyl-2-oxobutanoate hydroxymethyltransferase